MKTYKANVKINGRYVEVHIQAGNLLDAKTIIVGQYGKGVPLIGPFEVR